MDISKIQRTAPISRNIPVIVGVLTFGLAFQTVPLPISVSFAPFSCVVALTVFPWIGRSLVRNRNTPIFRAVAIFSMFVFIHSVIALILEFLFGTFNEIRILSWIKQSFTLIAGLVVYLVVRRLAQKASDKQLIHYMILGLVPTLVVSYLNLAWGLTGNRIFRAWVLGIRSLVVPEGAMDALRASGLSSEPSHYAFYLVVVVLPMLWAALQGVNSRRRTRILMLLTAGALLGTFSFTGLLIGGLMLVLGGLMSGQASARMYTWLIFGIALIVLILVLFPDNYIFLQVASAIRFLGGTGKDSASFADSFYSTIGPFMRIPDSLTAVGYGLGGTATHFYSVLPSYAADTIIVVKNEIMPSLGTLAGKLVAETGLVGLYLFLRIWPTAIRQAKVLTTVYSRHPTLSKAMAIASIFALAGNLVGFVIKQGSFALPFFWFWLGYLDARTLKQGSVVSVKRSCVAEASVST